MSLERRIKSLESQQKDGCFCTHRPPEVLHIAFVAAEGPQPPAPTLTEDEPCPCGRPEKYFEWSLPEKRRRRTYDALSAIEKQVARIEEKINARQGGSLSLWLAGLLRSPEENEVYLNAATFLIQEGVLEEPEHHIWQRLSARFHGEAEEDVRQWPAWRLLFLAAKEDIEDSYFNQEDAKDDLCFLAVVYLDVFKTAPQHPRDHVRAWCTQRLDSHFLGPLLERACPELKGYSYATHREWIEKALALSKPLKNPLASLREYVGTFHKSS